MHWFRLTPRQNLRSRPIQWAILLIFVNILRVYQSNKNIDTTIKHHRKSWENTKGARPLNVTDSSVAKLVLSEVDGDLNTVTKDIMHQEYHIENYNISNL